MPSKPKPSLIVKEPTKYKVRCVRVDSATLDPQFKLLVSKLSVKVA